MIQIARDEELADKTTFGIGGRAAYFCAPECQEDIISALSWARKQSLLVLIIGNGSNMLVSDKGWPGLAIDTVKKFSRITWNGEYAACDAGASLSRLVMQSVQKGFTGIQKLAGIPGSVGGAVVMNAGAFGCEIGECVESVDAVDTKTLSVVTFNRQELAFGYRSSFLKTGSFFVSRVVLKLAASDNAAVADEYNDILKRRKDKQPLDKPNCGSVFKRPLGQYAGALIEKCGLKGLRIGNAEISSRHANFILNLGGAKAEDVRNLMHEAQKRVWESTGILLEPEVESAGEFETSLFKPEE